MIELQSAPGSDPITIEAYFRASPAKMFEVWTQEKHVMQWFGKSPNTLIEANIDLKVGGKWTFVLTKDATSQTQFEGEYLIIDPNNTLAFTWSHVEIDETGARTATPFSRVDVTLNAKGVGTKLHLVHSQVKSEDARRGIGGGWGNALGHIEQLYG